MSHNLTSPEEEKNGCRKQKYIMERDVRAGLKKMCIRDRFKELFQKVMVLVKNVRTMDISMLLDCIREMKEQNFDIDEVLDLMQLWYRDVLMFKVTKDMNLLIFKDEYKMINETGEKVDYAGLEAILAAIDTARTRLKDVYKRQGE